MDRMYRIKFLYRKRFLGPALDIKDEYYIDSILDIDAVENELVTHAKKIGNKVSAFIVAAYLDEVDLEGKDSKAVCVYSVQDLGNEQPKLIKFPTAKYPKDKTRSK